jgi:histidinol-phosphatase
MTATSAPASAYASDLALAHLLADAADEVTQRYAGDGGPVASTRKPDGSVVTLADRETEDAVRALIVTHRPDDGLLGEEVGAFASAPGNTRRWILDGIDGTHSFAAGKPGWATMIALEDDGELVVGMITSPLPSLGQRAWAARGGGAFLGTLTSADAGVSDVAPLQCSQTADLERAEVFAVPPAKFVKGWRQDVAVALGRGAAPHTGSFGHAQILVAGGELDALCQLYGHPWDVAAGAVIVTEAGGQFCDLWGGRRLDTHAFVFANPDLTAAMLATAAPHRPEAATA